MRVLIVGSESGGMQLLRVLHNSRYEIAGVVTAAPQPGKSPTLLWTQAIRLGYKAWPATALKASDFAQEIRDHGVDVLLNVRSSVIIREAVLIAPTIGSFNLHTGPLPEYAGLNVASWAILNGEAEHGCTIHKMVPQIDAGPIASVERISIDPQETGLSLVNKTISAGIVGMNRLLRRLETESSQTWLRAQDLSRRRYYGKDIPQEGWIDWKQAACETERFIRACNYHPFRSPWGTPKTLWDEKEVGIFRATCREEHSDAPPGLVLGSDNGEVEIATGRGILRATSLLIGGNVVPAAEVLRIGGTMHSP